MSKYTDDEANVTPVDQILLPPLIFPHAFDVTLQEQPSCTHKTLTTGFHFIFFFFFMHK